MAIWIDPNGAQYQGESDENWIKEYVDRQLSYHKDDKANPHDVTRQQLGLDSVDNTKDSQKSVAYAEAAGRVKLIDTAGLNCYYGVNASGVVGFHRLTVDDISGSRDTNTYPVTSIAGLSQLLDVIDCGTF